MTEKTMPQAKRPFPMPYVMIWAVLASVSLAYLAVLAVQPALVGRYLGTAPVVASPQSNEGQRATADASAEIKTLRDKVGQVQGDLQELRAEITGQAERERELKARLAALETAPEDTAAKDPDDAAGQAAATPAPEKSVETTLAKAAPSPEAKSTERRAVAPAGAILLTSPGIVTTAGPLAKAPAAAKPDATKTAAAAPDAKPSIETGSVKESAPVTFGPAKVTVARPGKPVGLQIATGPSIDSLRLSWTLLADRHGDSFKSLQPRYTTGTDESGISYGLVVGPIGSAAEAKRMCKELGEKGTSCKVGDFVGDAL